MKGILGAFKFALISALFNNCQWVTEVYKPALPISKKTAI
jgi:hypothetical protein